jgi:hypothetical protein
MIRLWPIGRAFEAARAPRNANAVGVLPMQIRRAANVEPSSWRYAER